MKTDIRKKTGKIEDQIRELEEKRISLMIKEADEVLEKLLKEHSSVTVRLVKNPHESEEIAFEPTPGIRFKQDGHTFRFTRFGLVNKVINAKVQEIVTIDGEDCFLQESDWSPLYLLKKDEDVDRTSLHLDLTIQWLADSEYAWENNAYVPNFMDENDCDPFDLPYEAFPASANTASDNLEENDFEIEDLTDREADLTNQIAAIDSEIAPLNDKRNKLEKELDEFAYSKCVSAIIARMKSLGKDTICLREAVEETCALGDADLWGKFAGGHYAANILKLDECDNLILVYNDVTDYGEYWEYGDEAYESVVTVEIAKKILIPNMDEILNDFTDFYKQYRLPQDTSDMTDMQEMFMEREDLQSLDLSHFDTYKVTNMRLMFDGCRNLQGIDLSSFNTSNVADMAGMFSGCRSLQSLDLSSFDTSKVTDMSGMFLSCNDLEGLALSSFDTSNVTNMSRMFSGCSSLESLDLGPLDTSKVTSMWEMFSGCSSLQSLDLSSFDTSNVANMEDMFFGCSSLESLDLSSFDTSDVTNMTRMFHDCSSLESLDLGPLDTSNVTNMSGMFSGCSSLESLDLSPLDTSNVTRMSFMFSGCSSLESLDLSSFDTSNVTSMSYMFSGCSSLKELDLSNFNITKACQIDDMFKGCDNLKTVIMKNCSDETVDKIKAELPKGVEIIR